jgi:hypothetical protein
VVYHHPEVAVGEVDVAYSGSTMHSGSLSMAAGVFSSVSCHENVARGLNSRLQGRLLATGSGCSLSGVHSIQRRESVLRSGDREDAQRNVTFD